MAFVKFFLPALAVVGSVYAQNSCQAKSNDIQNQADADALASCETIEGDIVIAETVANTLQLNGIQQIKGSLKCDKAVNLTSISADSLAVIGDTFELNGLTTLQTLQFPQLTEVDVISWTALAQLQQLSFTAGVTKSSSVTITNTLLNSLEGINLEQVDTFNINNNPYLSAIDVQLGNVTKALILQGNSKALIASFPNLIWAFNMTFRNCSDVKLPSLQSVNGSLGFFDNGFQSFSAPNLTEAGGSLGFLSNPNLKNISMPLLTSIGGGYLITNNSRLLKVDGFKKLDTVVGAIDFSGNFTNVELPALKDVRGGFNLQTSATFSCDPFQKDKDSSVIKGKFTCLGKQSNPGTSGNGASGTSDGSSPTSTKKAAAPRIAVNSYALVGATLMFGGLVQFLL